MKALYVALASIPVIGTLLVVALLILGFVCTIYGLYLAFSASIILGIIVFVVEQSPFIIGIVMMFFDKNLAQMIVDFLSK